MEGSPEQVSGFGGCGQEEGPGGAPCCFCEDPVRLGEKSLAELRTVNSARSPNLGLRYWSCARYQFSAKFWRKKNQKRKTKDANSQGCGFFLWLDTPVETKEDRALARKRGGQDQEQPLPRQKGDLDSHDVDLGAPPDPNPSQRKRVKGPRCQPATGEAGISSAPGGEEALPTTSGGTGASGTPSDSTGAHQGAGGTQGPAAAASGTEHLGVNEERCQPSRENCAEASHELNSSSEVLQDDNCGTPGVPHREDRPSEKAVADGAGEGCRNGEEHMEVPFCFCEGSGEPPGLRPAVLRVVQNGRNPNKGLRYWSCAEFRSGALYWKKKGGKKGEAVDEDTPPESCQFFRWLDTPLQTKEQKSQAKKERLQQRELRLLA